MREFFLNLRIRSKLLSAFVLILIILLITGIKEYNSIMSLEQKKSDIITSIKTLDALDKVKYYVKSDQQILAGLLGSLDQDIIDSRWIEHEIQMEFIDQYADTVIENNQVYGDDPFERYKNSIEGTAIDVKGAYRNKIHPSFEELYRLQSELSGIPVEPPLVQLDTFSIIDEELYGFFKSDREDLSRRISQLSTNIDTVATSLLYNLEEAKLKNDNILKASEQSAQVLASTTLKSATVLVLLGLVISIIIAWLMADIIAKPINNIRNVIVKLGRGELSEDIPVKSKDEIGEMAKSLNVLLNGLRSTTDFSLEIEKGNFDSEFEPLGENDTLGNALLDMRNSLQEAQKEEQRRFQEDKARKWANEGFNIFSDILQQRTEDLESLLRIINKTLVTFVGANQAGFFVTVVVDDKEELELKAAYAFDRDKYFSKRVYFGEGLVGMAALERNTVHLTDLPDKYIEIASGTGKAKPSSLLIVPLVMEDQVLGVMEIASLETFPQYKIEFVERVAESIASTLLSIRINSKTQHLLEQSQRQADEMTLKEEMMRHSMEEMRISQEERQKREEELKVAMAELSEAKKALIIKESEQKELIRQLQKENQKQIKDIKMHAQANRGVLANSLDAVLKYDPTGQVSFFNASAVKLWGYPASEVVGSNVKRLVPMEFIEHTGIDSTLENRSREIVVVTQNGKHVPVLWSVVIVRQLDEISITGFVKDLTEQRNAENERTQLLEQIMASEFKYKAKIEELEAKLKESKAQNLLAFKDERSLAEDDGNLIKWGADFSIGLDEVDDQHRNWIVLINRLYSAFVEGKAEGYLRAYFDELLDYTHYHFNYENSCLKKFECPSTIEHMEVHDMFLEKITSLKNDYEDGKKHVAYELMNFLKGWVKGHIMGQDKQYVACFKKNGIR